MVEAIEYYIQENEMLNNEIVRLIEKNSEQWDVIQQLITVLESITLKEQL